MNDLETILVVKKFNTRGLAIKLISLLYKVCARDNLRGQKSLGPLKMSLETAQKVIVQQKKNYVPHFLKQRDINSYSSWITTCLKTT
jgi:hypothetical protein